MRVYVFVCVHVVRELCCGQGLWAPGSEMKDISHVAGFSAAPESACSY